MLEVFIRVLKPNEIEKALLLIWKVFLQYEAPDYKKEGVEEFYKTLNDKSFFSKLSWYGAFFKGELVGIIATRNEGTHIALFFVDSKYHRQGIGKKLFQTVKKKCPSDTMTVNSSPYAVPIYHKLGFFDADVEQVLNGLKFTPMEYSMSSFDE